MDLRACGRWLTLPRCAARHDGVDEDEQFPGASDQRALVLFARGPQSLIKGDELRVPAKGGRQRRQVERAAQAFAPTVDVTGSHLIAAVIVIGG